MRRTFMVILSLAAVSSWSQTVVVRSKPVLNQASATPAMALVEQSPVHNGGSYGNGATSPANHLSNALTNLQAALEEALPLLEAFNNRLVFTEPPGNNLAANLSVNLGQNFATNIASNFAVNLATPTVPPARNPFLYGLPGMPAGQAETQQTLLELQADIERMLPAIDALKGEPETLTNLIR